MAYTTLQNGLLWGPALGYGDKVFAGGNAELMDNLDEKVAMIGQVFIEGRATGKTISAAGGGSIGFRMGTLVFANAGTTLDIGIQDLDLTTSNPVRPDGTFDVKRTFTGGAGSGLTTASWNIVAMTGGSGSKTLNHGDSIAVVFHMTARGGADSVQLFVNPVNAASANKMASVSVDVGAGWVSGANGPNCAIHFDDGTLGYIDFAPPVLTISNTADSFNDSTNPDERGLIFQVPFDCKIDAFFFWGRATAIDADFTLKLYSDPLGTPTLITSYTGLAERQDSYLGSAFENPYTLPSEVALTANTDYILAVKADGVSNVTLISTLLGNQAYRSMLNGGTTNKKATRNNSTGAFTAESPAVTMYGLGVRISSIDFPSGGGGGSGGVIANPGLAGGLL